MKQIKTAKAPVAIGPYSQAILAGKFVFVSGQLGINPASGCFEGKTIKEQSEQVILNLQAVLLAAGSGLEKVIKTTCFLTDINDFFDFNGVYERYFPNKPARSLVEVSSLPKDALVEIEAIAEIKE